MTDAVITPGEARSEAVSPGRRLIDFLGRRSALVDILIVNSLLGIVTLGIYRFWARTRLRRFFWNSIAVDGDPLEYTGRGMELFVGFLIVVALLVPISGGYSVISLMLETTAPDTLDAINFIYFLTLLWLARYAYFRARRYRLSRTLWRGIRAGQDGSAAGYAWLWFGYAVVSVITLGWMVPWLTAEVQKYEVENARLGVENFSYRGTGAQLLRAWAPCGALWTLAVAAAVILTAVNWFELQSIVAVLEDLALGSLENEDGAAAAAALQTLEASALAFLNIYAIVIAILVVSIPFYFIYRIAALRFMIDMSSLADTGFAAQFSGGRVVGYWVLYAVISSAALIAFFFMVGSLGATVGSGAFGTVLIFVSVVILFIMMPIIKFTLFHYPVIRHVATTLAVSDIDSLDRVVQSTKDDPRFGEGLAAAMDFDVGGF